MYYTYIIAMYTSDLSKKQHPLLTSIKKLSKNRFIDDLGHLPGGDKGKSMEGLLGNYLMRQMMPENIDIDLLQHLIKFKPKKNIDIELAQKGKNSLLNFNWRF